MFSDPLARALEEWKLLLPLMPRFSADIDRLGEALLHCWQARGKVLAAGNGGSACDAIHLAEELVVRFQKNRRALAAISLTDSANLTCAGNDFGYENVFSRQVEALGNPGDFLIVFSTSGNSANILRAVTVAQSQQMHTVAFVGKDGGKLKGVCEFEFHVPSQTTARVQEAHLMIYHNLCEWIDQRVD